MNNPHEYPIDDLFRDKLENYSLEPSPTVWENISRSLEQKKRKHGILWIHTRNITTVFLIILLLIPFIGVFIRDIYKMGIKNTTNTVLINKKNNLNSNENAIHSQNNKNSLQLYDIIKTENLDKDKKNNNEFNKNNNKTLKSITIAGINKHNKTVVSKTPDKIVVKENNNNVKSGFVDNDNSTNNIDLINIDNNISNINKNEDIKNNLMLNNNVSIINNKHNLSLNETGLDFKLMTDNEKATYIPPPDDYGKRDLWNLGIHFTPEIIVNPFYSDAFTTNDNKYAYSFDITTTYRFGNMFVEGGVGLLYSLDKLNYKVEYEKLEAVGSYQEVELVTFDTIDNNLIPVYHTNTVNIYDTLRNTTIIQKSHTYSYLQIPFYLAYFRSVDRMNYFIKGGIAYNYLLNSKNPELIFFDKDAKILDINKKTPDRIKSNWNLLFSIGFAYRLSNTFTFSFEPSVRIYAVSLYDKNAPGTNRRPYAVGVKYGLILNL